MFMRMLKVDAKNRLLYARLDETPDSRGDVLDYDSSKPNFERWSDEMKKASGGKSMGNVRVMHNLREGGKVESMEFDDAAKAIDFCIKVVDDDVMHKCEEGIFTGISQGGEFGRRWRDGRYTRYTAIPKELSIVDLPANRNSTFAMIKADGSEELRTFTTVDDAPTADEIEQVAKDLGDIKEPEDYAAFVVAQPAPMLKALFPDGEMKGVEIPAGMTKRDFSDDARKQLAKDGNAMPDGSFPIENKGDLENAIKAHGRAKDKAAVQKHIVARAKDLKLTDELPDDWKGSTKKAMKKVETIGDMKKGLGDVASLTGLLDSLTWLTRAVTADATAERDGSPLPAKLCAWVQQGIEILTELASEETREAMTALQAGVAAIPAAVMAKAETIGAMAKAGARHGKEDLARVQAIHDAARDLGADCSGGEMKKVETIGGMAKMAAELAGLRTRMRAIEAENVELKKFKDAPRGGGPQLRAVEREKDGAAAAVPFEIEKLSGQDKTVALIKHAMAHPESPKTPGMI